MNWLTAVLCSLGISGAMHALGAPAPGAPALANGQSAAASATAASAPVPASVPVPAPIPAPISAAQASYDVGLTLGEQLRRAGVSQDIAMDAVTRGIKDGLGGKKASAGDQQQLAQYVRSVRETVAARNKETAREFLTGNAQQKGVKTTPSGLQYRVLEKGDSKGSSPQPVDQVVVQYRGKLLDGTEFDSSFSRGQPATFQTSRVIKGWQEALGMMKPGAKWQLFIPPELAYDLNSPPGIPPGSLLIFDVELVSVQTPPKSG